MDDLTPQEVARRAMHIFPLMGRLLEAQMRSHAETLSPVHFHVLRIVAQEPQSLSQLAEQQSVSAASMSRTVTVLEERGWLTRQRSDEDRRYVRIAITAAGQEKLHSITAHTQQYLAEAMQELSDDELAAVDAGMRVLIQAFADVLENRRYESDE